MCSCLYTKKYEKQKCKQKPRRVCICVELVEAYDGNATSKFAFVSTIDENSKAKNDAKKILLNLQHMHFSMRNKRKMSKLHFCCCIDSRHICTNFFLKKTNKIDTKCVPKRLLYIGSIWMTHMHHMYTGIIFTCVFGIENNLCKLSCNTTNK